MEKKEIIGYYYVFKYRTKQEAQVYKLHLFLGEVSNQLLFKLERNISGHFGSLGFDWFGSCTLNGDEISLNATKEIDWRFTFLDDERQDLVSECDKTWKGVFTWDNDDLKLDIDKDVLKLPMYKTIKDEHPFPYWLSRKIMETYQLDDIIEKNGEPGIYWRISDLIIKKYAEISQEGEKQYEMICEFNLEIVKEEKRVVNFDEIKGKRNAVKARFNNSKTLISFEKLAEYP